MQIITLFTLSSQFHAISEPEVLCLHNPGPDFINQPGYLTDLDRSNEANYGILTKKDPCILYKVSTSVCRVTSKQIQ